jgi:GntR family transcriptional repressor for pyruvate dehydrogenase complex
MTKPRSLARKLNNRSTLSTQIADHICREIRQKRLATGELLGTEAALAKQFGVSRTVVREAIGHLRGLGVVSSRQGRGLSVANGDIIDTLAKVFAPVAADDERWPEVCYLRYVLELGSIPLTVERATLEQIERLRRLALEMRRHAEEQARAETMVVTPAFLEREIEFHQLLFNAAGGDLAGRFHSLLIKYFHEAYYDRTQGGPLEMPTRIILDNTQEHLQLVDAIADRDLGKAVAVLDRHLRSLVEAKEQN